MIRAILACVGVLFGVSVDEPGRPDSSVDATYQGMKATAGRDAESQVKLALWCEAHGLEREKLKHLAVAVLTDPSNPMARGLLGLVEYKGKWAKPETVASLTKADMAAADLAIEYKDRRLKAPVKVEAQYKLALWCIEKGLIAESRAHLATVVRLDPSHSDAWRKLGYKKTAGRWVTEANIEAEKADKEAQTRADKEWGPRLVKLRDDLGSSKPGKRDEVRRALSAVSDPRAVPSVWRTFVEKGDKFHLDAVQILGQIDSGDASRGLTILAMNTGNDEVRRRAVETLRRRDPREFAGLLIALIGEKIKFEVKPVNGPGSQGLLYVYGKTANLQRVYTPGQLPRIAPGDQLRTDSYGNLYGVRDGGPVTTGRIEVKDMTPEQQVAAERYNRQNLQAQQMGGGDGFAGYDATWNNMNAYAIAHNLATPYWSVSVNSPVTSKNSHTADKNDPYRMLFPRGGHTGYSFGERATVNIPYGAMAADANRSAVVAQEQLKADVRSLEAANQEIDRSNAKVANLLTLSTGQTFGDDRKAWDKWLVNQVGYAFMTPDETPVPTVVENVPISYQPTAMPIITTGEPTSVTRISCFGKGTPVQTVDGPRPIESLNVGDRILTQNTKSGKLSYHPILYVHRNPPSPTFKVDLDGQTVVSSHFHRFWVAGKGWVMARDLTVGDPVRTLAGVSKVTAIEADKVQPVFNLDVADDADFFAGSIAALVDDNTLPDLRQKPFDAPPTVASK